MRLRVHVQPGAAQTAIAGLHGEALKIRVHAPPEDGRANAELEEFIARTLGLAKSQVQVKSGHSSRRKTLQISGADPAQAARTLGVEVP